MSKGIMVNGGLGLLEKEALSVSERSKETVQTRVFKLCPSFLLKHREPLSSNAELLLPTILIGVVAFAFRLL